MAKLARMDGDGVGVNKEVQSSIEKIDEIQNNLDRSVYRGLATIGSYRLKFGFVLSCYGGG